MLSSKPVPGSLMASQPPPRFRALVVDDVPEIGEFYRKLFTRLRIDTDLVVETDPREAIQQISEGEFDLVISDFRMKHADGIDVLRAAHSANPRGRRVLMTGYNEIPSTIARIREARVDAYLQKPLGTQDLLLLLGDLLTRDEVRLESHRAHAREIEEVAWREEQIKGDHHAAPV